MDSVEQILVSKNIDYTISGKDYVVHCMNPEHTDNNPSMRIDKVSGIFNCFSCGFSGNLFNTFNVKRDLILVNVQKIKDKIKDIMNTSLSMPLGYIPFYRDYRGISKETYKHFNVFMHEKYLDRIVFPITDITGNIKVFVGRSIVSDEQGEKYKNDPREVTMPLYPAKVEVYNNSIILVEGLFDMINLWDKGLKNVVCTFGTSFGHVKKKHKIEKNLERLNIYKLQGATSIFILYDGDQAGKEAANNLYNNLKSKYFTEVIELPEDRDPGELTQEEVDRLKRLIYNEDSSN